MTCEPSGLLAAMVATARVRAASMSRTALVELEHRAAARIPAARAFLEAIGPGRKTNVIAECKRRSPLKGLLRDHYSPGEIATAYQRAGAAAVSVVTEPDFFEGSLDDLSQVRAEVSLPLLRKDFIVDERQLIEARAAGADAVLLIVAALSEAELLRLAKASRELGLASLVEVHGEGEVERALQCEAAAIGVNARDLRTMRVMRDALPRVAERIPAGVARVAESGIRLHADIVALRDAGYDAFLVGERLMTSEDPGEALAQLIGPETPCS